MDHEKIAYEYGFRRAFEDAGLDLDKIAAGVSPGTVPAGMATARPVSAVPGPSSPGQQWNAAGQAVPKPGLFRQSFAQQPAAAKPAPASRGAPGRAAPVGYGR